MKELLDLKRFLHAYRQLYIVKADNFKKIFVMLGDFTTCIEGLPIELSNDVAIDETNVINI
jgi:hypothetical protein